VIGKADEDIFSDEQTAIFREQDKLAFDTATTVGFEEAIHAVDGALRIVKTAKRILPAPKGQTPALPSWHFSGCDRGARRRGEAGASCHARFP
jgi:hypothetical protein